MREKITEFDEGKFISDRSAGVLSEPNPLKAVRRVLRDKSVRGLRCPTRIDLLPALDSHHRGAQDEKRPFTKHVTIDSNST